MADCEWLSVAGVEGIITALLQVPSLPGLLPAVIGGAPAARSAEGDANASEELLRMGALGEIWRGAGLGA